MSGPAAYQEALLALADELIAVARQEARRAVQEAIADLPGSSPRLTTLARYARAQGLGYSTVRRWVKACGVQPQAGGRYVAAELDAVVARGGAPALAPNPVHDLVAERARRAAAGLKGGHR